MNQADTVPIDEQAATLQIVDAAAEQGPLAPPAPSAWEGRMLATKIPLLNLELLYSRETHPDGPRFILKMTSPLETDFTFNGDTYRRVIQDTNNKLITLFKTVAPEGFDRCVPKKIAVLLSLALLINKIETIPKICSLILKENVINDIKELQGRNENQQSRTVDIMKAFIRAETFKRDETPDINERLLAIVPIVQTSNLNVRELRDQLLTPKNKLQELVKNALAFKDRNWWAYMVYLGVLVGAFILGLYAAAMAAAKAAKGDK